ncbi:MarR family winged helix-turn-helix transcriptional regulator [Pusillimonas noertemannii]|uniref:DNA-binding MarR family transcriptional regulator n=1 Tax=Pusillimonas noertemannii TaxID=305977 RepID=A0A2U1CI92_9BURK|nr:MarR family winged helix-turn-helix transcriptional regulator [Pusillimonas noertemannii]NYT70480.1 winged helix-turn-helix transcriptional regulator [Pusillimonas noertemannii]PVY60680.1 DNA-binding MarR family transcriptional regulator [Pusillimonas noertemannii]TFL08688.1 MarR family transcriptional regulator [Pusillimonas noertemannii]
MPNPKTDPPAVQPQSEHIDQSHLIGSVGYCCLQAYLEIVPNIRKQLAKLQLRPVEYTVLSLINSNPLINQKRLGQTIRVSPPNLATLLDRMQSDGLIDRQRNPNDRRSQILALTPKGQETCRKAENVAAKADITPTLTDAEREQLTRLLIKVFHP